MFQVRIQWTGRAGVVTAAEMLSVAAFNEGRHAQAFPSQDPTLLLQVDLFGGLGPDAYILLITARGLDELGIDEYLERFRPERVATLPATERRVAEEVREASLDQQVLIHRQIEGSEAVARAVALCRPEVIAAYPISPQTHNVETLSDLVRTGELAPCEYLLVESEFAAMSAAIGASAAGARACTATASQGILYMAEALYTASGLGLPIVMTVANRAIGSPINVWNDHSDAMSQRDSGWIQLYAEDGEVVAVSKIRRRVSIWA